MGLVSTRMAQDADDFEAARRLCRDWLDWHWCHYPSDWPRGADHPMDPTKFEAIIRDLPTLHQRPLGGILIGSVDKCDAGCVMYHEAEPGIAEFKRMFVSESGRGHGLGRRMLQDMFKQMIADGYQKVFFSSATFLTQARAMYESVGCVAVSHPPGFPEDWRERVYFMERALA